MSVLPAKKERDDHETHGGSSWRTSSVIGTTHLLARAYDAMQAQQEVQRATRLNLNNYLRRRARHLKDSKESALEPADIRRLMKESETTPLGLAKKKEVPTEKPSVPASKRGRGMFAAAAGQLDAKQAKASADQERRDMTRRWKELDAQDAARQA
jgi:hypothetical protein